MPVTTQDDAALAVQQQLIRDRKAAWARRNYAEKSEEQNRCRADRRRQARDTEDSPDDGMEEPQPARRGYDVASYVEEFRFLTAAGRRSDDIINASTPSIKWFRQRVRPHITRSICASCSRPYNPQDSGMLTRCSETCGIDNEGIPN